MSKRTRLLSKLKHVYSHNTKLVLDVSNDDIGLIIEGVEKQIGKKPYLDEVIIDDYEMECLQCPVCDSFIGYEVDCKEEHYQSNYCSNCGQKLLWDD